MLNIAAEKPVKTDNSMVDGKDIPKEGDEVSWKWGVRYPAGGLDVQVLSALEVHGARSSPQ